MADLVVKKSNKLGAKTWLSIVLFGLMGQLAWMVENMYFANYIQANVTTDPVATSATVTASAIVAALVTIFGGVLSDRVGKRKVFMCYGYIIWGLVTASFALFGNGHVSDEEVKSVVVIFVVMDCVMTLFGSMSNDAAFSSWVTDVTDITNRGFVDIVLSILPVAALMIIFVGFNGLTVKDEITGVARWDLFFVILGALTTISGVVGLFIMKDSPNLKADKSGKYLSEVLYGFKPANVKKHGMIYICLVGMMLSGLAMQLWQPYMIMLLQYTLGFGDGFVIPLALCILLSAGLSVVGGKLMDKYGKDKFFYPVTFAGVLGGLLVFAIKFVNCNPTWSFVLFVVGGTLIESSSLMAAGLFNATARDYTPKEKAGCFQGIRIIIFVTLPMVIASLVLPTLINTFGPVVTDFATAPAQGYPVLSPVSGYNVNDHVYPFELFLFAGLVNLIMIVPTVIVKRRNGQFRNEKLHEIDAQISNKEEL